MEEILKQRMDSIIDSRDEFPYELYTLMCAVADEYGVNMTMDLYGELLNG